MVRLMCLVMVQEESQLAKITKDSSKITVEQVHGLMSQVRMTTDVLLFAFVGCAPPDAVRIYR